jgi:hypothetical protein
VIECCQHSSTAIITTKWPYLSMTSDTVLPAFLNSYHHHKVALPLNDKWYTVLPAFLKSCYHHTVALPLNDKWYSVATIPQKLLSPHSDLTSQWQVIQCCQHSSKAVITTQWPYLSMTNEIVLPAFLNKVCASSCLKSRASYSAIFLIMSPQRTSPPSCACYSSRKITVNHTACYRDLK